MSMPAWLIIAHKELRDAIRDRRAVLALLLFPLLGPLMIYFMLNSVISLNEEARDLELPVVGAVHAPDLMDYLRQNGVIIRELALEHGGQEQISMTASGAAIQALIDNRDYDFVLLIPEDFPALLADSIPVNLELHHDSSRTAANARSTRAAALIQAWNSETAALRLLLRGVSADVIQPVSLTRIDVASAQARAQSILAMIPMLVVMAAFVSGMGLAVDATAGERERKSLEPLLVNPVRRSSIVIGKWLAAVLFSAVGLALVLGLNLYALSQVPLEEIGVSFNPGVLEISGILITTLPLAFFATSIQLFLGIFARSFKDAQAYLSLIIMLPVVPYFFNIFNTNAREFWMNFVPMLGQHMLLTDVVSGRPPSLLDFSLAGLSVFISSLFFIFATAYLFRRERVIFT